MNVRPFLVLTLLLIIAAPAVAQVEPDVSGTWVGTLNTGAMNLRVVANISEGADGGLEATLDSPDQGTSGIPVNEILLEGRALEMHLSVINARFTGTVADDGTTIEGTWSQGGASLPLTFERTDAPPVVARPQEPQSPFPYRVLDVRFPNPEDEIELAGTLTLPEDPGRYPAAVLISGSGAQDRDEALFGHRPFFVLADYLTRRGIAVLRFDDRGFGESSGDFSAATTPDFASDARAAMAYLRAHDQIDTTHIGLIGHSEGGLVAPMAAVEAENQTDFVVLLAAPAVAGEEILYRQDSLITRASGASEEQIRSSRERAAQLYAVIKAESDPDERARKLEATMRTMQLSPEEQAQLEQSGMDVEALIQQQMAFLRTPWFRYFLMYDPLPTLMQLDVPVLALTGEKDLQVPPDQNLPLIREALNRPGQEASVVREIPSLNHLFQPAETGHPSEYAQIEQTFSPDALEIIADWILQVVKDDAGEGP